MLIKLTQRFHIAADAILQLEVDRSGRGVIVTYRKEMPAVIVDCDPGKTAFETRDRLVSEINAALAPVKEVAP